MSTRTPLEITVNTLKQYREEGVDHIVLDVREPAEIAQHKYEGALEIPMGQITSNMDKLPDDKTIVVMCHLGGRSAQVMSFLRQNGFDNATNLEGGIEAWSKVQ